MTDQDYLCQWKVAVITDPLDMTKLRLRAPRFSNAAVIGEPANTEYFKAKDIKIGYCSISIVLYLYIHSINIIETSFRNFTMDLTFHIVDTIFLGHDLISFFKLSG